MWGLFNSKPTCPVPPDQQRWIENRFRWLEDQFGADVPRDAEVILPTPEYFPDPYDGPPEEVLGDMIARVASYMNVDAGRFNFTLYDAAAHDTHQGPGPVLPAGPAGYYVAADAASGQRPLIGVEIQQLDDPMSLVATIAHEIAHELLLGEQRITPDTADHEPLTDLLTVFLGLGIFTANATVRDRGWSQGAWAGWQTTRLGYLDQQMFGYALGHFAWKRDEPKPDWLRHVRPDVRVTIAKTLKYLAQSEG